VGGLIGQLITFSAASAKAPRVLMAVIPFAALTAAYSADLLPIDRQLRYMTATLVLVALVLGGVLGSQDARTMSAIPAVGEWLSAHPGKAAGDRVFDLVAVDPSQAADPLTNVNTVSELRSRGDRWAIVDAQNWAAPFPTATLDVLHLQPPSVVRELLSCATPVARFDDPAGWSDYFFLENADSEGRTYDDALRWRAAGAQETRGQRLVFDLKKTGPCG
jgi:hypothetical protein